MFELRSDSIVLKFHKNRFCDDVVIDINPYFLCFFLLLQKDIILWQREKIIMLCQDFDTRDINHVCYVHT